MTTQPLTLADVSNAEITIAPNDFSKMNEFYEQDVMKNKIKICKFKIGSKPLKVEMTGEVATNGIAVKEWDNGEKSYSIGIRIDESADTLAIEELIFKVTELVPKHYEISSPVKDDIIYLKLKTKDKKTFGQIKSNLKLSPKTPCDTVFSGMNSKVLCEVNLYINFDNSTAGLVITPLKFDFEE